MSRSESFSIFDIKNNKNKILKKIENSKKNPNNENYIENKNINQEKINDLINKLNESTKKEESLSLEISQLKEMIDKKNSELIKSSLLNANNIININNNHNNISNSVMMNNNMVSDNEIIDLLKQKINRISCDNKTLETKIKMYKDEKKLSQDMVQKLQYEVITLKKKMEKEHYIIQMEIYNMKVIG